MFLGEDKRSVLYPLEAAAFCMHYYEFVVVCVILVFERYEIKTEVKQLL